MTIRLAILAALLISLAAPAAPAAVPNGDLIYGWSESNEGEDGPFDYTRAILRIPPQGGRPRTISGCKESVLPSPSPAGCVFEIYTDPAVSHDGGHVAFDRGVSVALADLDGGDPELLPAASEDDGEPSFSAAGGRLAFSCGRHASGSGGDGRGICVRDLVHETVRRITGGTDPDWSAHNWIAFETNDDEQIWAVRPGGKGLHRLTRNGFEPAWSPEGRRLAFVRGNTILVLDLRTHRTRRVARELGATDIAWSPDGRKLAYTIFDGGIETIRVTGGEARTLVRGGVGATYDEQAVGVAWQPLR